MEIEQVSDIITLIADNIEDAVLKCMHENAFEFSGFVRDQLLCGTDGTGRYLEPTYDNDPYFQRKHWRHTDEDGTVYEGAAGYKAWKMKITPPQANQDLKLGARPDEVPNLFIDGTFYNTIDKVVTPDGVDVIAAGGDSGAIVSKYGDVILEVTDNAIDYFNKTLTETAIADFFKDCGYK
jgi:hypothetical protein